jgi:serine/threonine protein kinase/dipeptidyl aminopeptidase/acylaminoacyl peptidase
MIGETILHYKIIEKLGEGGMGVVYKAEDIKLKRLVALKFLPSHITASEEDLARFNQEAQAAAALNHPNICIVYAIEEDKERQFIVMEYVDGITLSRKIEQSPLKMKDAISYAIQIGEALQEAHSNGIVHRDIKTENIMVNTKNQIKVMDFGLAKLKGSIKLTKTSSTVGTLAYMAPEQIQGGEVDARSDIFSFGVVLFEMLTGLLPFLGEHDASMMYSIMNEEPEPLQKYIPDANSDLIHIMNRILEKDPEDRYQSMKEIVSELRRLQKRTGDVSRKTISYSPPLTKELPAKEEIQKEAKPEKRKLWLITGSLAVVIILAGLSYFLFIKNSAVSLPPMKTVNFTSSPGIEEMPAFSPDGKSIAFVWNGVNQDNFDIYVKLIGAGSPLRLTNNPALDFYPAWSPDGRYIAFQRSGKGGYSYYIVPSLGGDERKIADVEQAGGGIDWSPDGKNIVVSASDSSGVTGIMLISISTGEKKVLTSQVNIGFINYDDPKFSPDGNQVAFIKELSFQVSELFVVPTEGGEEKQLTFDKHNILCDAWTPDGKEIVFSSNRSGNNALWRIPSNGGSPKLVAGTGYDASGFDIGKEGNELAYTHFINNVNIWRLDLSASASVLKSPEELITTSYSQIEPQYSPDGKYITFTSNRSGTREIWRCNKDGTNPVQLTSFGGPSPGTPRWSPDGQSIAFDCQLKGIEDIYIINSGGGTPRQITFSKFNDQIPSWSGDGKWIYFTSNRTGVYQIWKIPSNGGKAVQVTKNGGYCAFESYDSKYLYFAQKDNNSKILRVPVTGGEEEIVNDKILNNLNWGGWALTGKGIYFAKIDSNIIGHIYYYNFDTKKAKPIFVTPKPIWPYSTKIDVSPDGRLLLFVEVDEYSSNIILTQNFQ